MKLGFDGGVQLSRNRTPGHDHGAQAQRGKLVNVRDGAVAHRAHLTELVLGQHERQDRTIGALAPQLNLYIFGEKKEREEDKKKKKE